MAKILIVEDDLKICSELQILLQRYNYQSEAISDFYTVVEKIQTTNADLVLLDLTLPNYDGFHILKEVRKKSNIPIIILTSQQTEFAELMSMQLGADDYVSKPFNPQILIARVQAVLTRVHQVDKDNYLIHPQFRYNTSNHELMTESETTALTSNEHHILEQLLRHKGQIVTRHDLMDYLWSNHEFVDDNTLTVNVNRLRKKLASIGLENLITTKRGEGYLLK